MALPPIIPDLPPAPSRSDGPAGFTAKADAMVAALQPMVTAQNQQASWMNDTAQQVHADAIYAGEAAGAADAAKLAAQKAVTDAEQAGAAQVELAQDQVALSVAAKDEAQSAAQAAGAAAGLPGGRVPYTVLQINAAGNVSWGDGLIDKTNAVPGQALMLGTGKTPQWAFPGQQVGDVLISARDPGALYLPANGSIRLQSAYPALFAKLGLIGGAIGTAWADYDFGGVTGSFAGSTSGTIIVVQSQTQVRRSADRGQTWANITTPALGSTTADIKTDGQGTWIISSTTTGSPWQILRSTDDGQTWQLVTIPAPNNGQGAGAGWDKLLYCGNATWLLTCAYGTTMLRSINGGASWSTLTHGYPISSPPRILAANGTGTVLISSYDGTNYTVRKSTDYGATFSAFMTLSSQPYSISTDGQGTWIIGLGGTNALRSFDDATTSSGFVAFSVAGGSGTNVDVLFVNGFVLFLFSASVKVIIMNANGSFSPQSSSANVMTRFANVGNGIIFAGSSTANRLSKSTPQFGYDTATQFALPNVPAAIGTSAYIKAKELT